MPLYMDILNYIFTDETSKYKVILMIHFILTTLGSLGSLFPTIYLFYNIPLLFSLFWSIQTKKTSEPLRSVMALELCLIPLDMFYIGYQIDDLKQNSNRFKGPFSAAIAIFQIFFRAYVIYFMLKTKDEIDSLSRDHEDDDDDNEPLDNVSTDNNPFEPPRKR